MPSIQEEAIPAWPIQRKVGHQLKGGGNWQGRAELIALKSGQTLSLAVRLYKKQEQLCCQVPRSSRKLGQNHYLSAHETGHGKSTRMSLQLGVGGHDYRKRELGFPRAFTLDKTRTRDKRANLGLPRKFPKCFALHVVLEELLSLGIEFARFSRCGKRNQRELGLRRNSNG